MDTFTSQWQLLPKIVQRGLLVSSEGKLHLMHLAQELLKVANQSSDVRLYLNLAMDLLQAAWTKDPLDGHLAGQLLALNTKWPRLEASVLNMVQFAANHWVIPENLKYYQRLAESGDGQRIHHFLSAQFSRDMDNLFWRQQMLTYGFFDQNENLVRQILDAPWPDVLTPCRALFLGNWAWLGQDYVQAVHAYNQAVGLDASWRRAKYLYQNDQKYAARTKWQEILGKNPWMISETLHLYDIIQGTDQQQATFNGPVAIALYSFNKDDELNATLASVFASKSLTHPVWVLDNGSTDTTAQILSSWKDRMGQRLEIISLPVNIGAPAARNWLMHLPQIRQYPWMIYLDDDVELPSNWLKLLAGAVQAYPEAGVWGCKVVDHAVPAVLQCVDLHLEPVLSEAARQAGKRFEVSGLHRETMDFGQFDYVRPCTSVTGCCHLFRTDRLHDFGDFDLRFSPSQFDDLEHDIRLNLAGHYAVYQGFLRVRHKKRTGHGLHSSPGAAGSAFANMHKLQTKYTQAQFDQVMNFETDLMLRDFWAKRRVVRQWLEDKS